jgi:hypothetical protein
MFDIRARHKKDYILIVLSDGRYRCLTRDNRALGGYWNKDWTISYPSIMEIL